MAERENFSKPGMPPQYYQVLDTVGNTKYIEGHHPRLGDLHAGWSGPETIVYFKEVAGEKQIFRRTQRH